MAWFLQILVTLRSGEGLWCEAWLPIHFLQSSAEESCFQSHQDSIFQNHSVVSQCNETSVEKSWRNRTRGWHFPETNLPLILTHTSKNYCFVFFLSLPSCVFTINAFSSWNIELLGRYFIFQCIYTTQHLTRPFFVPLNWSTLSKNIPRTQMQFWAQLFPFFLFLFCELYNFFFFFLVTVFFVMSGKHIEKYAAA